MDELPGGCLKEKPDAQAYRLEDGKLKPWGPLRPSVWCGKKDKTRSGQQVVILCGPCAKTYGVLW